MSKPLRTEEEAERELEEALRWYEEKSPGLGEDFMSAVDEALARIQQLPGAGTRVPCVQSGLPVRRVPLKKFPYHVVYLEEAAGLWVLATEPGAVGRIPGTPHVPIRRVLKVGGEALSGVSRRSDSLPHPSFPGSVTFQGRPVPFSIQAG